MRPIQLFIKVRSPSTLQGCIKIMNAQSIEKTTPRLAVTKTARAAFIHNINTSQENSTYTHKNTHKVSYTIIHLTAIK